MRNIIWYDKLQYAAMVAMAAAMPIGFHVGLWAAFALAIVSVVKIVASRRVGNPSLTWPMRIPLIALAVYWLLHLISVAYGGDVSVGMRVVELKAVLLVFAMCFLLTDTSYLDSRHIRWLFYALAIAVFCVFVYFVGVAIGRLCDGAAWSSVTNSSFDSRHHAYVAMYVDIVLAFIYVELISQWGKIYRWLRVVLIVLVPICALYILLVNSRAGVLIMWAVAAVAVLDMAFNRRRWWLALAVAVLFSGYVLGMGELLPGYTDRIQSTVETVSDTDDDSTDARVEINRSAVSLALEKPVFGHGAGSYRSDLVDKYDADDFGYGARAEFNAHNQYVETVLSIGAFGLLFLLAFLLWPLLMAIKLRRHILPVLLVVLVICANLLFESMLERQMGLLFIGYFMSLMTLLISMEENKFGQ